MKKTFIKKLVAVGFVAGLIALPSTSKAQDNVGIGTTSPDASAILELLTTNKGLLVPRMTALQRLAIPTPANSLLVYDTDSMCYFFYRLPSTSWISLCNGTGGSGSAGATGATGPTGSAGVAGATGPTGANGATGATGAAGSTGATGVAGATGATGTAGATGATGATGVAGATGVTGATGAAGATGATGATGTAGATGATGATGTTGATGPSWTLSSVTYNANGTITVNGTAGSGGPISSTSGAWLTTGNSGTTAPTNFIGTTDAQPFVVKTNGSAATNERMRFQTTPQATFNAVTAAAGDLFSVYGTGYTGATNSIANQTDFPINGYSTGAFAGLYGENTATGQGVLGNSTSTGVGAYGNNNSTGFGVAGINTSTGQGVLGQSTSGFGVNGVANGTGVSGVRGFNANTAGTGIVALGTNITPGTVLAGGSGIAANGTANGIFAIGTNPTTGVGVMGGGTNITTITTTGQGEGVAGNGSIFGTTGYATIALSNNRWGGYFDYITSTNGFAYIGGRTGGIDYGILSSGTKSTMVKDFNDNNRIMYCTEAPEVLFQDFGTGQLVNGHARIELDEILVKNIYVSDEKPLKVFIQLEGDCKGVFVSNKSKNGFDVTELAGGNSNVKFTWQIVANRADEGDSNYSSARFPIGPNRVQSVQNQSVELTPADHTPAEPLKGKR